MQEHAEKEQFLMQAHIAICATISSGKRPHAITMHLHPAKYIEYRGVAGLTPSEGEGR
jgi:hypothetical protein